MKTCRITFFRLFLPLLLVLWLPGCILFQKEQIPSPPGQRLLLGSLDHWLFQGRIAVHSEEDGWQASLRWEQQGADFEVGIRGPLGQGAARLLGSSDGVVLHTADGVYRAKDPEQLLAEQLGVRLPVSGFRYWVLGLPHPQGHYQETFDDSQQLRSLQQDGWDIRYSRYRLVDRWLLPGKIVLDNEQWHIRLVLDQWDFFDEGG